VLITAFLYVIGFNVTVSTNISGEKSDIMKVEAVGWYAVLVPMYHITLYHFSEFPNLKFIAAL
jgi:hypothetical protein